MSQQALAQLVKDIIEFADAERDKPALFRQGMVEHMIRTSMAKQLGEALARTVWP